jgi:hypothetical protein
VVPPMPPKDDHFSPKAKQPTASPAAKSPPPKVSTTPSIPKPAPPSPTSSTSSAGNPSTASPFVKSPKGKSYHTRHCTSGLTGAHSTMPVTASEILKLNLSPCKHCKPSLEGLWRRNFEKTWTIVVCL